MFKKGEGCGGKEPSEPCLKKKTFFTAMGKQTNGTQLERDLCRNVFGDRSLADVLST